MSTEIKNTLFRFITMRVPELLNEKSTDKNFVTYPKQNYDKILNGVVDMQTKSGGLVKRHFCN